MPNSADVLSWSTLTPAVNEMKAPNAFLKNMLFSRDITVPTRNIELSFLNRGRQIAPFVERNGAAIMTEGRNESFRVITPPHIRVKRPMTPSELLEKRRPGSVIFPGAGGIQKAMREYMASELAMLGDDITNSEEYLCALALRGAISYSVSDEASFTITFPRDAAHDYALGSGSRWNETTASPRKDFLDAAQLVNDAVSLNVTDVILGSDAADAFLADAASELSSLLDIRRMSTGTVDLTQQIAESGALFLGTYVHGIRVWRYGRSVEVGGVATPLIRAKYAEFVARTPAAQFVTYYGAIEDMKAIGAGKVLQSKRFSKSWEQEDPSARMLLVESNPMPVMRRPDASVSVQVLA
jgi:hypothetical protein